MKYYYTADKITTLKLAETIASYGVEGFGITVNGSPTHLPYYDKPKLVLVLHTAKLEPNAKVQVSNGLEYVYRNKVWNVVHSEVQNLYDYHPAIVEVVRKASNKGWITLKQLAQDLLDKKLPSGFDIKTKLINVQHEAGIMTNEMYTSMLENTLNAPSRLSELSDPLTYELMQKVHSLTGTKVRAISGIVRVIRSDPTTTHQLKKFLVVEKQMFSWNHVNHLFARTSDPDRKSKLY